jgi:uncharacterized protein YdaU (DUF1376 family)
MHYYQHHIGDFIKDTNFLTNEEVGIYLKLLWLYYDTEKPLPDSLDILAMKVSCRDNKSDLLEILETFFTLVDGEWHHIRCDKEIAEYQAFCVKQKANGLKGGRPKVTQQEPNDNPMGSQVEPKITLTTNHKPLTNIGVAKATKGTRWQKGFALPNEWVEFCKKERYDLDPTKVFEEFTDYWVSVAGAKGVKADWSATWRNWIRNQKGFVKASVNNLDEMMRNAK